jgi:dTDP-4-amino-4,6-dideoxygalactose transaminase
MINLQKEYEQVEFFEQLLAAYTGSPYAVCVDSCTNALLLCLLQSKEKTITLPSDTYIGVAMAAQHAGKHITFTDTRWTGAYHISPTNIYDSAKRFTSDMYIPETLMCLSFHYKKHLKIGRGGAILTDNKDVYEWLKLARNCGKDSRIPLSVQTFNICGFNMLLHPDLAAKGIDLLKELPSTNSDLPYEYYGDLRQQIKFKLN